MSYLTDKALHPVARYLFGLLELRRGDYAGRDPRIDKYEHSLQCATRALHGGEARDYVMMALFHDVFGGLNAEHHAQFAAETLRPWLSEPSFLACALHAEATARLCAIPPNITADVALALNFALRFAEKYDLMSFDPNYHHLPIEFFKKVSFEVFK